MPIGKLIWDALANKGWVFIPPDYVRDLHIFLHLLGPILPAGDGVSKYRDLVPISQNGAPPRSMSSVIGTGEQPMHTDRAHVPRPPRYLVFQCIDKGEAVCPTYVWSANSMRLRRNSPGILTNPQWVFHDYRAAPFYSPIVEFANERIKVRFDPLCMRPATFARICLAEAYQSLSEYTERATIMWENGAILLIDNWTCFHGRAAGSDRAPSRRLRRWYIGERNGLGI